MTDRPGTPLSNVGRRSLPERRARERRVLWVGLAVSLVAHLVAVGLVGGWLEPDPTRAVQPQTPMIAEPPPGMRAVEIAAAEPQAPAPEEPEEPEPEEPEEPEPEPAPEPAPVAGELTPADTLTAADRLAPRVVDPRLWEPMVLLPLEPTIEEVEARVGAAIEMMNDSMLAEAEAAMRARDWTVVDEDGGRWGISPGKIHLGSLTLPLPIWLPVDPEAAREQRQWYELDRALERTRILDTFRERVQAIRERRDRERAERRGENGGDESGG
jgi:hypothetical protein